MCVSTIKGYFQPNRNRRIVLTEKKSLLCWTVCFHEPQELLNTEEEEHPTTGRAGRRTRRRRKRRSVSTQQKACPTHLCPTPHSLNMENVTVRESSLVLSCAAWQRIHTVLRPAQLGKRTVFSALSRCLTSAGSE